MTNTVAARKVGRPPGADAEKTRNDILDAALRAFAERGFEGTSIREITGEVGVGHNLVRHYFGSKEDLWRAAVRYGLGPAADRIAELLQPDQQTTAEQALRDGLAVVLAEAAANPDAFRLLISESIRGGSRFDEMYDDVIAPLAMVVFNYVATVRPDLADVDPRVLGLYVFGAALSPFSFEGLVGRLRLRAPRSGALRPEHEAQLISMILSGLIRRP